MTQLENERFIHNLQSFQEFLLRTIDAYFSIMYAEGTAKSILKAVDELSSIYSQAKKCLIFKSNLLRFCKKESPWESLLKFPFSLKN